MMVLLENSFLLIIGDNKLDGPRSIYQELMFSETMVNCEKPGEDSMTFYRVFRMVLDILKTTTSFTVVTYQIFEWVAMNNLMEY